MRRFSSALLLAVVLAAAAATTSHGAMLRADGYYKEKFLQWMKQHGYEFKRGEFERRLRIWADNDDYITVHNAANHTFTLGHNAYSHLSPEEFTAMMGLKGRGAGHPLTRSGSPQVLAPTGFGEAADAEGLDEMQASVWAQQQGLADSIDGVEKGAVTAVKNQGQCGSCWSFSTTGNLEGAYAIKTGKLVAFSEQELVSCDHDDNGCGGGLMDVAFEWLYEHGPLCTEEDYPYTGTGGLCRKRTCTPVPGSHVMDWVDVHPSEQALMKALNVGPVSVAIEADQRTFQLYETGVLSGPCGTNLDHGVLAVGYGVDETTGTPYWKVKNSWGPTWGEGGYIKLQRGVQQYGGQCGILLAASYISELA